MEDKEREILFRGISKKTKDWVYGWYYEKEGKQYIISNEDRAHCEIMPGSRGQYIGIEFYEEWLYKMLKVFEGDIFEVPVSRYVKSCKACGKVEKVEVPTRLAVFYEEKEYSGSTDHTEYKAEYVLKDDDFDYNFDTIREKVDKLIHSWANIRYVGTLYENPDALKETEDGYPAAVAPSWVKRWIEEQKEREKANTDVDIRTIEPEEKQ